MLICFSHVWHSVCDPMGVSPPGSTVHGILQARILEWVAVPYYRGSSRPRDWTGISYVSYIGRQVLYQHHLGIPEKYSRTVQQLAYRGWDACLQLLKAQKLKVRIQGTYCIWIFLLGKISLLNSWLCSEIGESCYSSLSTLYSKRLTLDVSNFLWEYPLVQRRRKYLSSCLAVILVDTSAGLNWRMPWILHLLFSFLSS